MSSEIPSAHLVLLLIIEEDVIIIPIGQFHSDSADGFRRILPWRHPLVQTVGTIIVFTDTQILQVCVTEAED
jgi:hypothetical protein